MAKNDDLIASLAQVLSELTFIERHSLLLKIEGTVGFEVVDAAIVMAKALAKGETSPDSQEETYNLWLRGIGPNRKRTIKAVKLLTGLSLGESKNLVARVPVMLKKGVSRQEAEASFQVFRSHGIELTWSR